MMSAAEVIAIILAAFLLIRLAVVIANVISSPKLRAAGGGEEEAGVSILIPARNEENNIGRLLESLTHSFAVKEILVLDDDSTDRTAAIVEQFAIRDSRVKLIKGLPLAAGWLGKNYACHQLAQHAKGKYLLFIDADVDLYPGAVASASGRMKEKDLSLLSLFPDQEMITTGEKLVVPFMHYFLLSLLPLRLVASSSRSSLAAANGQFMMFRAEDYMRYAWHEKVKNNVVEDVEIMREVKRQGLKGEVLLANGFVRCRMYSSGAEAVRGFSKNLLPGIGNIPGLVIYFSLICWLWPALVFLHDPLWLIPIVAAALVIRLFISLLGNQSVIANVIMHPVQLVAFSCIAVNSVYLHLSGNVKWKGRKI